MGERATTKSDVYALAAVLYECFTGVVPYPKEGEAAVLYAHMADPPPRITDLRPELPVTLDEVIARGMAKDPAERHESGGELLLAVNRSFTRRMRAAFTPPGPIETPEELGIRPPEQEVDREAAAPDEPPTEQGARGGHGLAHERRDHRLDAATRSDQGSAGGKQSHRRLWRDGSR